MSFTFVRQTQNAEFLKSTSSKQTVPSRSSEAKNSDSYPEQKACAIFGRSRHRERVYSIRLAALQSFVVHFIVV